jgi:hypothetical protein
MRRLVLIAKARGFHAALRDIKGHGGLGRKVSGKFAIFITSLLVALTHCRTIKQQADSTNQDQDNQH